MIYLQLFLIFSKIGIVGFGGGYAMLSLIQDDVVTKEGWLSAAEFTDIVAVSQMTPGPLGINMATYVGYTSVLNAGYPPAMAFLGSLLATFSILWLPFILMMLVSRFLLKHKDSPLLKSVFGALRWARRSSGYGADDSRELWHARYIAHTVHRQSLTLRYSLHRRLPLPSQPLAHLGIGWMLRYGLL